MVKLTSFQVLFATTLLAAAGCSKDEGTPEPAYGESTAPGPGASSGDESATSIEYDVYGVPKEHRQASGAASAKAAQPPEAELEMRAFSDGQIVRIMETVDTRGIEQAEIALQESIDPHIIKFAAQMVRHHTESKQKAERLAEQTRMTLQPSALADELARRLDGSVQALRDADPDPERFDILYIDGQVAQHSTMLGLLESQLIPSAASEQLEAYLSEARTKVSDHLEDARAIEQGLTRE